MVFEQAKLIVFVNQQKESKLNLCLSCLNQKPSVFLSLPNHLPSRRVCRLKYNKLSLRKVTFCHVTEQSLRVEVQGKKSANDRLITGSPPPLEEEEADEDETPQKRQERLWKRRDEMS